jgi:hypothetical protein
MGMSAEWHIGMSHPSRLSGALDYMSQTGMPTTTDTKKPTGRWAGGLIV